MAVTLTIVLCSFGLQVFDLTLTHFERRVGASKNVAVYLDGPHRYCNVIDEVFIHVLVSHSLGLWIPLLIIISMHIAMFIELKKQAQIRAQTTSNKSRQMQQTLKIFVAIVFVFFTCSLPLSILNIIMSHPNSTHNSCNNPNILFEANTDKSHLLGGKTYMTFSWARNFCVPLAYINSCLNPFIYSKVHLKIYAVLRWVYIKVYNGIQQIYRGISKRIGGCCYHSSNSTRESETSANSHQPQQAGANGSVNKGMDGKSKKSKANVIANTLKECNGVIIKNGDAMTPVCHAETGGAERVDNEENKLCDVDRVSVNFQGRKCITVESGIAMNNQENEVLDKQSDKFTVDHDYTVADGVEAGTCMIIKNIGTIAPGKEVLVGPWVHQDNKLSKETKDDDLDNTTTTGDYNTNELATFIQI